MSGDFERQSIHIPEAERPTVVMPASHPPSPPPPPAHTHHSTVPQQNGPPFRIDDKLPDELTQEGVCSERTMNSEKGSIPQLQI